LFVIPDKSCHVRGLYASSADDILLVAMPVASPTAHVGGDKARTL
jgi:hypothetical protein